MRVVLVVFGSVGDVRPFVALGRGLLRAGHSVRLCSGADAAEWADLDGLDFVAVETSPPPRPEPPRPPRGPWFVRLARVVREVVAPQFDALLAAARGADLVLNTGGQLVVSSVAEALGARHRSVLISPQLMPSRRHPPLAVPWASAPRWVHRAGRRFYVEVFNRLIRAEVTACRRRVGLAPLADDFAANHLDRPIVACDPELGPVPPDCEPPATQVGYLHLDEPHELAEDLERFLAARPPPVYVGLGSANPGGAARLTRVILEAVAAAGCRAVVGRGWAGLGEGIEKAAGGAVHFTGPVPHHLLFPRVAAVVHHGGAGTTASAARAGRPQIILPPGLYDQDYWRQQVVERGLGVGTRRPQRVTARQLARALERVLGDSGIARRAAALGQVLRRRDAVRDTVALLEADT